MSSDAKGSLRGAQQTGLVTVRVRCNPRGGWEVVMSDVQWGVICETLEDARRVAYLSVARTRRCELIVTDAYHRVVRHELIDGHSEAPGAPAASGPPEFRPGSPQGSRPDRTVGVTTFGRQRAGAIKRRLPTGNKTTHQRGQ